MSENNKNNNNNEDTSTDKDADASGITLGNAKAIKKVAKFSEYAVSINDEERTIVYVGMSNKTKITAKYRYYLSLDTEDLLNNDECFFTRDVFAGRYENEVGEVFDEDFEGAMRLMEAERYELIAVLKKDQGSLQYPILEDERVLIFSEPEKKEIARSLATCTYLEEVEELSFDPSRPSTPVVSPSKLYIPQGSPLHNMNFPIFTPNQNAGNLGNNSFFNKLVTPVGQNKFSTNASFDAHNKARPKYSGVPGRFDEFSREYQKWERIAKTTFSSHWDEPSQAYSLRQMFIQASEENTNDNLDTCDTTAAVIEAAESNIFFSQLSRTGDAISEFVLYTPDNKTVRQACAELKAKFDSLPKGWHERFLGFLMVRKLCPEVSRPMVDSLENHHDYSPTRVTKALSNVVKTKLSESFWPVPSSSTSSLTTMSKFSQPSASDSLLAGSANTVTLTNCPYGLKCYRGLSCNYQNCAKRDKLQKQRTEKGDEKGGKGSKGEGKGGKFNRQQMNHVKSHMKQSFKALLANHAGGVMAGDTGTSASTLSGVQPSPALQLSPALSQLPNVQTYSPGQVPQFSVQTVPGVSQTASDATSAQAANDAALDSFIDSMVTGGWVNTVSYQVQSQGSGEVEGKVEGLNRNGNFDVFAESRAEAKGNNGVPGVHDCVSTWSGSLVDDMSAVMQNHSLVVEDSGCGFSLADEVKISQYVKKATDFGLPCFQFDDLFAFASTFSHPALISMSFSGIGGMAKPRSIWLLPTTIIPGCVFYIAWAEIPSTAAEVSESVPKAPSVPMLLSRCLFHDQWLSHRLPFTKSDVDNGDIRWTSPVLGITSKFHVAPSGEHMIDLLPNRVSGPIHEPTAADVFCSSSNSFAAGLAGKIFIGAAAASAASLQTPETLFTESALKTLLFNRGFESLDVYTRDVESLVRKAFPEVAEQEVRQVLKRVGDVWSKSPAATKVKQLSHNKVSTSTDLQAAAKSVQDLSAWDSFYLEGEWFSVSKNHRSKLVATLPCEGAPSARNTIRFANYLRRHALLTRRVFTDIGPEFLNRLVFMLVVLVLCCQMFVCASQAKWSTGLVERTVGTIKVAYVKHRKCPLFASYSTSALVEHIVCCINERPVRSLDYKSAFQYHYALDPILPLPFADFGNLTATDNASYERRLWTRNLLDSQSFRAELLSLFRDKIPTASSRQVFSVGDKVEFHDKDCGWLVGEIIGKLDSNFLLRCPNSPTVWRKNKNQLQPFIDFSALDYPEPILRVTESMAISNAGTYVSHSRVLDEYTTPEERASLYSAVIESDVSGQDPDFIPESAKSVFGGYAVGTFQSRSNNPNTTNDTSVASKSEIADDREEWAKIDSKEYAGIEKRIRVVPKSEVPRGATIIPSGVRRTFKDPTVRMERKSRILIYGTKNKYANSCTINEENRAPTLLRDSIFILAFVACNLGCKLSFADVYQAFLQLGELDFSERFFLIPPIPVVPDLWPHRDVYWEVIAPIYGMPDIPSKFFTLSDSVLRSAAQSFGVHLRSLPFDNCVYMNSYRQFHSSGLAAYAENLGSVGSTVSDVLVGSSVVSSGPVSGLSPASSGSSLPVTSTALRPCVSYEQWRRNFVALGTLVDDHLAISTPLTLKLMREFNKSLAYKKLELSPDRSTFSGFDISQKSGPDDRVEITLSMDSYLEKTKEKLKQLDKQQQSSTPDSGTSGANCSRFFEVCRTLKGLLQYGSATNPSVLAICSITATDINNTSQKDVRLLRSSLDSVCQFPAKMVFSPLKDFRSAVLVLFHDSSFANRQSLHTQGGYSVFCCDQPPSYNPTVQVGEIYPKEYDVTEKVKASLISFRSRKIRRVTNSTLSSEVVQTVTAYDGLLGLKVFMEGLLCREVLCLSVGDCASFYDAVRSPAQPHRLCVNQKPSSSKRLDIDLAVIREVLLDGLVQSALHTTDKHNYSDELTKVIPRKGLSRLEHAASSGEIEFLVPKKFASLPKS